MTDAQIEAGTLEANLEDRTVSGLLVPYGEIGRTNLGKFAIAKGAITIPRDVSVVGLNVGHNRENPVGRAASITDSDAGLYAAFKIADTDEGDQYLKDVQSGRLTMLSAEIKKIVLRGGQAVAGQLFGAGGVERGAFPSAALMASDTGDPEDTVATSSSEHTDAAGKKWTATTTRKTHTATGEDGNVTTTITENTVLSEPANPAPTEEQEPLMAAATIPNTLEHEEQIEPSKLSFHQFTNLLGKVAAGSADDTLLAAFAQVAPQSQDTLFAALTDIKLAAAGSVGAAGGLLQPQWLGELAKLATAKYKQKVLPLFAHESLTSFTIQGFRWTTEFAGGDWGGDKAAVPSNAPVTAAVTTSAARFGGAWDVAREFRDFNVPGFWAALYSQSARSYFKWADAKVTAAVLAGATTLEADNPTGLTIGAGWSALIDGAVAMVSTDIGLPEFALVAPALYKSMLKTPADDVLGYLNAALGLEAGTIQNFSIRPNASLAAGNILVGVGAAATVFELPGVPIRAEGLDMTKGGIDPGLFGYLATIVDDAEGLQLVTPYTA